MIAQESILELRRSMDIVRLVGAYLPLKARGKSFVGLCPFHQEKTPSFNVNPQRGTFKCFGCGKGGDAIRFVMEHDRLNFVEALRNLADRFHVELREEPRR